jgi:RHS repeat-associated protein
MLHILTYVLSTESEPIPNLITRHYGGNGQRAAMREAETISFLLSDHPFAALRASLGSTNVTTDNGSTMVARLLYKPFGQVRYNTNNQKTDYRYTGQWWAAGGGATLGLYDYGARWYDPPLARFVQADTIVPQPGNPGSLNRYSYTRNNPLRYTDPTGMFTEDEIMNYLGVKTWEEVLKMFEKGGKFAGEWGWLEVLRQAELGDTISLSFGDDSNLFYYEMEGQLMFLGNLGAMQVLLDLPANVLPAMTRHTGMYRVNDGNVILSPYKNYHMSYDASKVDSTSVGLTIWSATADIGFVLAIGSAAVGQPVPALAGAVYWMGGTTAGWVDLGRSVAQWQRGEASRTDLTVDVGTTVLGSIPVAGIPMDILSLSYELQKGLYVGP